MPTSPAPAGLPLATFVAKAEAERLALPALMLPPHAIQRFGPPTGNVWTAKSEAQNRWLGRQVTYDPASAAETSRSGFADQHTVDRIVNTGVAWHEGQLFGWINQLIGVLTALALIAVSILGVVMWLKRRPQGQLGAPHAIAGPRKGWLIAIVVMLAVLLPLFGASLLILLIVDGLVRHFVAKPDPASAQEGHG